MTLATDGIARPCTHRRARASCTASSGTSAALVRGSVVARPINSLQRDARVRADQRAAGSEATDPPRQTRAGSTCLAPPPTRDALASGRGQRILVSRNTVPSGPRDGFQDLFSLNSAISERETLVRRGLNTAHQFSNWRCTRSTPTSVLTRCGPLVDHTLSRSTLSGSK